MRLLFPLVVLSLLVIACNKQASQTNKEIAAKVESHILLNSEIEDNIPEGLSKEDSLHEVGRYVNSWIRDNLLYDIAAKNIADKSELNRLVESYKRSLMINQYQAQLVNEKLSKNVSEDELQRYYAENQDLFKLDKTLIKGLYLKVPMGAADINKLKEWYRSPVQKNLEKIEKYSIQNAVSIDYFEDRWIDFNELTDNLPIETTNPEAYVRQNKLIEVQDSSYYYFLNIKEALFPGDKAPFQYARPTIKEILVNQRKMEFLKKVEDDLYNTALEKRKIKIFKNN